MCHPRINPRYFLFRLHHRALAVIEKELQETDAEVTIRLRIRVSLNCNSIDLVGV